MNKQIDGLFREWAELWRLSGERAFVSGFGASAMPDNVLVRSTARGCGGRARYQRKEIMQAGFGSHTASGSEKRQGRAAAPVVMKRDLQVLERFIFSDLAPQFKAVVMYHYVDIDLTFDQKLDRLGICTKTFYSRLNKVHLMAFACLFPHRNGLELSTIGAAGVGLSVL